MSAEPGLIERCDHSRSSSRRKRKRSQYRTPHKLEEMAVHWRGRSHISKDNIIVIDQGEVGLELSGELRDNEALRKTIREAIRNISNQVDPSDIHAFIEHDQEDPEQTRVVLEVKADIDEVEEYQRIKEDVREIVRAAERGDIMVYTRISRD